MSGHSSGGGDALTKFRNTIKQVVRWVPGVIVVLALTFTFLLWAPWRGIPGSATSTTSTNYQQARGAWSAACPGVMQTFEVPLKKEMINFGADCSMDWNIDQGALILITASGEKHIFTVAKSTSFRAVYWQAASTKTLISAAFCPNGTLWQGAAGCR